MTIAALNTNYIAADILANSNVNRDAGFMQYYAKSTVLKNAALHHSWTRASAISIGRAAIGGGFTFVRHPIYGTDISEKRQKEIDKIMVDINNAFFAAPKKIKYIQDTMGLSSKMYYTANSFVLYGQFTWEKIRDRNSGKMIGFDVLPGVTMPNVDDNGKFLDPAYYFRPWNSQSIVEYKARDLMFVTNPGLDLSIFGSTDYDSLSDNTIPSDLYAAKAYKFQFENINAPYNGVWVVDPSTSEQDYADFLAMLANRYTGIEAFGSNPLVIRGQAKFEEHRSRSNDDAPYLEGRRYNQEEISAVTGVSSAKLGITDNASKTNHRELRREFHENTLRPVFQFIEEGIYNQIMVQEFDLPEYKLAFNRPDLSTALEEATILGRYVQNGVITPNEARSSIGKQLRSDPYGDKFFVPSNGGWVSTDGIVEMPMQQLDAKGGVAENTDNPTTSQEEVVPIKNGGSNRQFDMARNGEEDANYERKSEDVEGILTELRQWKRFESRRKTGKRDDREFVTNIINPEACILIKSAIADLDKSDTCVIFDNIISEYVNLTKN